MTRKKAYNSLHRTVAAVLVTLLFASCVAIPISSINDEQFIGIQDVATGRVLPLRHVHVSGNLTQDFALVELTQQYLNDSPINLEVCNPRKHTHSFTFKSQNT